MLKKLTFILALFISLNSFAQDIPARPNPPRLVNDMANVLSSGQEQQLEMELEQFARETSNQIAIVTVPDLGGYPASEFAFLLGEKWGVGQKDKGNGVVVLFKPKTSDSKGQIFVAIGYGLEGAIPDAVANRDIIDYEMIPRFKQGDVYGGLYAGTQVIKSLAKGEFSAAEYHEKASGGSAGGLGVIIFLFVIFFLVVPILRGRKRYYGASSRGSSLPFWLLMGGMMGSGRSHGGSYGNFSSGGGGFGGFGGGGFGGGGAGGSW